MSRIPIVALSILCACAENAPSEGEGEGESIWAFYAALLDVSDGELTLTELGDLPLLPIAHADFNGDGALDRVSLTPLDGDGAPASNDFVVTLDAFGDAPRDLTATDAARDLASFLPWQPRYFATDVDGDGAIDLLIAARGAVGVRLLPGNGDGTFDAPLDLMTGVLGTDGCVSIETVETYEEQGCGAAVEDAALIDVDADGDLDVVVVAAEQTILEQTAPREFAVHTADGLFSDEPRFYRPLRVLALEDESGALLIVATQLGRDEDGGRSAVLGRFVPGEDPFGPLEVSDIASLGLEGFGAQLIGTADDTVYVSGARYTASLDTQGDDATARVQLDGAALGSVEPVDGHTLAIFDSDGDGTDEVAASPSFGRLAIDGVDVGELPQLTGNPLWLPGDYDGDGAEELLVMDAVESFAPISTD